MTPPPVLPGAEPFSAAGDRRGALVLHGFTGSPQSMRGLAQALARAGFSVELPRLPGHGTSVEDMAATSWADWSAAAEDAYQDLAARCHHVVVAGLSMGGTLTCWLAARHPEIAGIAVINGVAMAPGPEARRPVDEAVAAGVATLPAVGGDIAAEGVTELAYDAVPARAMQSLFAALDDLQPRLAAIRCPVLVLTSPEDHIVPAAASDHLAASVSGPVERVTLARSYHVATLDHDRELIERSVVEFAEKVTAG